MFTKRLAVLGGLFLDGDIGKKKSFFSILKWKKIIFWVFRLIKISLNFFLESIKKSKLRKHSSFFKIMSIQWAINSVVSLISKIKLVNLIGNKLRWFSNNIVNSALPMMEFFLILPVPGNQGMRDQVLALRRASTPCSNTQCYFLFL